MSNPSRKQIKISADLIARTLHNLDELNVPYVVLIDGIATKFTNTRPLHAAAILERQYLIDNKIAEFVIEAEAERQTVIPQGGDATA
jgi:hypothetical protein